MIIIAIKVIVLILKIILKFIFDNFVEFVDECLINSLLIRSSIDNKLIKCFRLI